MDEQCMLEVGDVTLSRPDSSASWEAGAPRRTASLGMPAWVSSLGQQPGSAAWVSSLGQPLASLTSLLLRSAPLRQTPAS